MKRMFWFSVVLISLACQMSAAAVGEPSAPVPTVKAQVVIIVTQDLWTEREWIVCADVLRVRGGPGTNWSEQGILYRGEVVRVREWSHNGNGWAMIAPARWVNGDYLQLNSCN